jgi:hypothetical protein
MVPRFPRILAVLSVVAVLTIAAFSQLVRTSSVTNFLNRPVHGKQAASFAGTSNDNDASELVQEYAEGVDAVLRDARARLQRISDQERSGELDALKAQSLRRTEIRRITEKLNVVTSFYGAMLDSYATDDVISNAGVAGHATPDSSPRAQDRR